MENSTKRCPYCGEEILAVAKKCKHCGTWIEGSPEQTTKPSQVIKKKSKLLPLAVVIAIIAIAGVGYLLLFNDGDGNVQENSTVANKIERKYYDALAFGFNGHVKKAIIPNGNAYVYEYSFDSDGAVIAFRDEKVDPTSIKRDSNGYLVALISHSTDEDRTEYTTEYTFEYENGKIKRTAEVVDKHDGEYLWGENIYEYRTLSTGANIKITKSTLGVKRSNQTEYHYYPTSEDTSVIGEVDEKGNPLEEGKNKYEYWE